MDLVEIRKKANDKKKKPAVKKSPVSEKVVPQQEPLQPDDDSQAEQPVSESVSAPEEEPISVAAEAASTEETETVAAAEATPDAGEIDPLDALFSFKVEGQLATEGTYLQSLVGGNESVDDDIQQWLTFSLADEEYALTINSISEIIKPREVTDIPRVPAFIRGIISLRGIIVPVFDLNQRLNLGSTELSNTSRIIVCQDDERLAGFLVDSINQVVNVPVANIEPPPTVLSGLDRDFVEGVGRVDDKMLILLHLSNVINAELTD